MIDVDGYKCHVVLAFDEHSLIARTCLQRPSDGYFAVGYVERISATGDEDKAIDELVTPLEALNFTTEDVATWSWWPTQQEAIEASKDTFAPFDEWIINASNK